MQILEQKIKYFDIDFKEKVILIDVRTEKEYNESHIPGAHTFPILSDEERAEVGTIYKQVCSEQAKDIAVEYGSKKIPHINKKIKALMEKHGDAKIILYCQRGGMRSGVLVTFLRSMGYLNVFQLDGGYKEYRNLVVDYLENSLDKFKFVVLHGHTGVGKTNILNSLEDKGYGVLNLERCANNAGSVFGNIVFRDAQPTQKQFENKIFRDLVDSQHKFIFVESESRRIGKVTLPNGVYNKVISEIHILVDTSVDIRVKNIYGDYLSSNVPSEELKDPIKLLKKRLGNEGVEKMLKLIDAKEYEEVIRDLMVYYYDPLYIKSIKKYEYLETVTYEDINECVERIIDILNDKIKNNY